MGRRVDDQLVYLKTMLKENETLDLNKDELYYDRLHDNIMAAVEKTEVAPLPPFHEYKRYWRAHWKDWSYSIGVITSLFAICLLLPGHLNSFQKTVQRAGLFSDGIERITQELIQEPDILSQTLFGTQSEGDFFMDVASESFEHLEREDLILKMGVRRR